MGFLSNLPTQAGYLLHSLEQVVGGGGLRLNTEKKNEYICFNFKKDISTLNGGSLKLVSTFAYFSSNISSTESDINKRLAKVWSAIDR